MELLAVMRSVWGHGSAFLHRNISKDVLKERDQKNKELKDSRHGVAFIRIS